MAGLRFKAVVNGEEILLKGNDPIIKSEENGKLNISWPLNNVAGKLAMEIDEQKMSIKIVDNDQLNWYLDLSTAKNNELPFQTIHPQKIDCQFDGMNYSVNLEKGRFSKPNDETEFRISAQKGFVLINLVSGNKGISNL
jgi:hypothetical protein